MTRGGKRDYREVKGEVFILLEGEKSHVSRPRMTQLAMEKTQ